MTSVHPAPSLRTARLAAARLAAARLAAARLAVARLAAARLAVACLAAGALAPAVSAEQPPNVVLIMTDDQGYGDLGATGNPLIRTPHIDAMARRSGEMTRFYVSPVCAPTRASLMTGRYNYRTRCIDTWLGRAMMDPAEVTVAEMLREAGYATGIFGKWHLGDNHPMRPQDQGFEHSLVHRGGGIGQPADPPGGEGKYTDPVLFRNGSAVALEGYCTDLYYREAKGFIERAVRARRPFFAYLPDNCPHGPFHDVPRDEYARYREEDLSNARFPSGVGHPLPERCDTDKRARIFAMITGVDTNVGRLFGWLDELGVRKDTIVIFMTDNGPNGRRWVAGMRGMKTGVHEGGIRSPFFIHWPARIAAGMRVDQPAAHIDVTPTILDACGVEPPAGLRLDGRSFLPLLTSPERVEWPDRTIYIQAHRGDEPVRYHHFAARGPRWKLLHASGFGRSRFEGAPRFELYDLKADPLEEHDVAAAHPEVVKAMRSEYDRWFDDVSSTRPQNYAPPRISIGSPHENPTTLTRQDWRHLEGRPWARDSVGRWLVRVETAGRYDVTCRFAPGRANETLRVEIGDRIRDAEVSAGVGRMLLPDLRLPPGEAAVLATLAAGGKRRGVHQVDVRLRPAQ